MAIVEIETGLVLTLPDHNTALLLSDSDAAEMAAQICESVATRFFHRRFSGGEIEIEGNIEGGVVMKVKRNMEQGMI
jgi:hypothetical protein